MEVHYEGTEIQNKSIQRVLTERGKTVYATIFRFGAILVDNGKIKLLSNVRVFGVGIEKILSYCIIEEEST